MNQSLYLCSIRESLISYIFLFLETAILVKSIVTMDICLWTKVYYQTSYIVNVSSCHVITMHCPDCVLIGSFKVGPQKLSDNSRQPVSINKKIRKRLTARLSMGVWSSGSWVPGQEKDVPFYTYWRWINGLTVLESVNSFYSRQHLVERWKGEVFNITPIYQKMKAGYFMRSLLPFVRYFIFTSSF